jgi:hypothetical protein
MQMIDMVPARAYAVQTFGNFQVNVATRAT